MRSYFRYSQTVALSQGTTSVQPTPFYLEGYLFLVLPILLPLAIASCGKYRRMMQNRQIERLERLWLINIPETTF